MNGSPLDTYGRMYYNDPMSTPTEIPASLRESIQRGEADRFLADLAAEADSRLAFAKVLKGRHPGLSIGDRIKINGLQCLGHAKGRVGIVVGHNGRTRVDVSMIQPVQSIYANGRRGPKEKVLSLCPSHFTPA